MSKTLLEFEDKWIDIYKIELVEKATRWNDKELRMDFNIEINRPYNEGMMTKMPLVFSYQSETLRDEKMELLRLVLDSNDVVHFVQG